MSKFVVKKGRERKAKKIESVLCEHLQLQQLENLKILDIGCGTGEMISYFSINNNEIYAVDVFNQIKKGISLENFQLVNSAELPFPDGQFDVIFSNHVVEHIEDQSLHMSEISRCLKQNGVCYFATPNRNYFIEPHHKIPFIHYLTPGLFHWILKKLGKYEEDLYLLSYKKMTNLFKNHDYKSNEYTIEILKNPKKYHLEQKFIRFFPKWFLKLIIRIIPTNIFILEKS